MNTIMNNERIRLWIHNPIMIFGAGKWGDDAYNVLIKHKYIVKGFVDNNKSVWGTEHKGITVFAPFDAVKADKNLRYIIAVSSCKKEIRSQLLNLGVKDENILDYSFDVEIAISGGENKKWSNLKPVIIPSEEQDYCMGCGACISACKFDAIKLIPDEYGYYKPQIDKSKCVNCGKCDRVCPAKNILSNNNTDQPKLYSFYAADLDTVKNSSSGGVFTLLAEHILEKNGAVVGAAWNKDIIGEKSSLWDNELYAEHTIVSDLKDLHVLKKSKYMQSYLGDIGCKVKARLEAGEIVLFSGCPCQVAGVYSYLGRDYDNLYTVDILCGNSPSTGFFQKYLEDSFDETPCDYEFRHKDIKWDASTVKVVLNDGLQKILHGPNEDYYQNVYHDHTMCPVHCQMCKYHSLPRIADLTIGDFWGYSGHDPEGCNTMGTSAVLVNNVKGQQLLSLIQKDKIGSIKEVPIEWLGDNGYIFPGKSNYCSKYRDRFYRAITQLNFIDAVKYAKGL